MKRERIGSLWSNVSKSGNEFMSGEFRGEKIIIFKNRDKMGKQPDWLIFHNEEQDKKDESIPF